MPYSLEQVDRVRAALWGLFIGDALAMPVHWYYNTRKLKADFGTITKYEAPKASYPDSIMNLSNTGGGGRGGFKGNIVGDVILHGKKKYWSRGAGFHYHHGMKAGESTLDALVALTLMERLNESKGVDNKLFLDKYITFMTTKDSHNDKYAGTCHRMFFANYVKDKAPLECADNDGHNTDAIDGLTNVIPTAFASFGAVGGSRDSLEEDITSNVLALRKSKVLPKFGNSFGNFLLDLAIDGKDLKESLQSLGEDYGMDLKAQVARYRGDDPMTACYINSSFPVMLFFAYKYGDDAVNALLRSTNAGGENVARGAALGALLGATHGMKAWEGSDLVKGLVYHDRIEASIEEYVKKYFPTV